MSLVLASGSAVRARLLRDAGLVFAVRPGAVDEAAVKQEYRAAGKSASDLALALAEAKASADCRAGETVIGADSVLVCGDDWFDKPADRAAARLHLQAMRGRAHQMVSAVAVARNGAVAWRHVETVTLVMRQLDDAFIDDYLARAGDAVLSSVGAYQIEALGVTLFERVDGDYFSVLGLPLLPLLGFLRQHAMAPA